MSDTPLSDASRVHNADLCDQGHDWSPYCRYEDMQKLEKENQRLLKHCLAYRLIVERDEVIRLHNAAEQSIQNVLAETEKERDQWRQCAGNLAVVARTIDEDYPVVLRMAEAALDAFNRLNTPNT